ncbi:MAG: hypothetical protein HC852_24770 [Acaryochloridaceae cyanobacterium RU_4_10]|nr:hypothetical protein [Acaryochloridaceae cyanobacterium RU_4_10]
MHVRKGVVALVLCCLMLMGGLISPSALAAVEVRLFDLAYQDCPPELAEGSVTSGGTTAAANCFLITGQAENKSGKKLLDADVFGRIYDANNNSVMENRTRLGAIEEVPPGITPFEMRMTIPKELVPPLRLEQFKASGFSTKVR